MHLTILKYQFSFLSAEQRMLKTSFSIQGHNQPQKKGADTIPTSFQMWGLHLGKLLHF